MDERFEFVRGEFAGWLARTRPWLSSRRWQKFREAIEGWTEALFGGCWAAPHKPIHIFTRIKSVLAEEGGRALYRPRGGKSKTLVLAERCEVGAFEPMSKPIAGVLLPSMSKAGRDVALECVSKEFDRLQAEIKALKGENEALKKQLSERPAGPSQAEFAELQSKLGMCTEEKRSILATLAEAKTCGSQLADAQTKLTAVTADLEQLKKQLESSSMDSSALKCANDRNESAIKGLAELKQQMAQLEATLASSKCPSGAPAPAPKKVVLSNRRGGGAQQEQRYILYRPVKTPTLRPSLRTAGAAYHQATAFDSLSPIQYPVKLPHQPQNNW